MPKNLVFFFLQNYTQIVRAMGSSQFTAVFIIKEYLNCGDNVNVPWDPVNET